MNSDDKEDHLESDEDAFYEADYDDDTIDYELDSDKLLDDESFEPELMPAWGDEKPDDDSAWEKPAFDAQQEYTEDSGLDTDQQSEEIWDEDDFPEEDYEPPLPLGLIAVAVIALLLLAAGGYGVIQQRTAMQEEIRSLQAALSTTSSNTEVTTSRQAQRALVTQNEKLQSEVERLQLEIQGLNENLTELKPQVPDSEPSIPTKVVTAPPPPKPVAAAKVLSAPQPDAIKPASAEPSSSASVWFVNFGSYTQEPVANSWAAKLKSDEGKVVVVSGDKGGTHYFRVRIIDLPNREIAEKIARQLEQAHNLPRLWIGKQ
ncbi:MAG: SPOR domain-containing protein [Proteobacteria bacterium]|nr:SPOR domain-containing protein [Pseudomonadota bacterium]